MSSQPFLIVALCAGTGTGLLTSSVAGQNCAPEWLLGIGDPGMTQSVQSSMIFDDGTTDGPALYAGGGFTSAGGNSANHIARWDGQDWTQVGNGVNDVVAGMVAFDDGDGTALYAIGDFTSSGSTTLNYVARWTGSEWTAIGAGLGGSGRTLAVFDDGDGATLYAGGGFTSNGKGMLVRRIAFWNGSRWQELGGGVLGGSTASVQALAVFDDGSGPALYVGGNFGFAGGNDPHNNIAKWDGESWSTLGDGVSGGTGGNVLAMEVFDDGSGPALYVAGLFTSAGGQPIGKLARWDGQSWSAVGGGVSAGLLGVQELVADHEAGKLYITGTISSAGGMSVSNIAVWDGESWSGLGSGLTGGVFPAGQTISIGDIGQGRSLFVGGTFTSAGSMTANRIAELAIPTEPTITLQPEDTTADFGDDITFTVQADHADAYQWRFKGTDLIDGNGVSGATTDTLQLQSVTLDDAGMYDVIVSNDCGSVQSDAAELDVEPKTGDLDGNGVVDTQDLFILLSQWGQCPNPEDCPADLDGNGVVDTQDLFMLLANWG